MRALLVLYLAALQTIPSDIYEAATMDGAGRWQQFWFITLPSLKPMMFFGVTLSVIGGLQLFEEPFMLIDQRGGELFNFFGGKFHSCASGCSRLV